MRRSAKKCTAVLFCLILNAPAHAQVGQIPSWPPVQPAPSGGCSYLTATCNWIAAVQTAGGSVSTTQKGCVDTLITTLKGDSLWNTVLDRLWLFDAENTQQAGIDIVNLGTFTSHGTVTFIAASTATLTIFAENLDGSGIGNYSTETISETEIGGGLTPTQADQLHTALATYNSCAP